MNMLTYGLTLSLAIAAGDAQAEVKVNVDGDEVQLSALMDNCNRMSGQPEAQIACFNAVSKLLDAQSSQKAEVAVPVPQALEDLRAAAQYQDDASGLSILGTDCKIQTVYFNNYYYLSRRNVSSIDVVSAQFDASRLQHNQTAKVQVTQPILSKGVMEDGVVATMHGGFVLESNQQNFEPKSARVTLADYANEVITQLPGREDQAFDFVLVHPNKQQDSARIWDAFDTLVKACAT